MRAIRLPDPPGVSVSHATPEIFDRGLSTVVRRAVIIGNGAAGAEHQSIGLVRALGLASSYTIYRVDRPKGEFNRWLRWLPLGIHKKIDCLVRHLHLVWWQRFATSLGFRLQSQKTIGISSAGLSGIEAADARKLADLANLESARNGPLLVLAAGRDTVSIAESVKKLAPGATFVVQIQHPRRCLDNFDMVITPVHDYYTLSPAARQEAPRFLIPFLTPHQPPDKRVVLTVGALHLADPSMLRSAAETWHSLLAPLPKPLLIVNIGGPMRCCHYGQDLAQELASKLKRVLSSCGSVRISYSRRTPAKVCDVIQRELGDLPNVHIFDGTGPNPHLGHLAWGDAFVVTADSISMLSEACSTGKPVYVLGAERCTWKFRSFHKSLRHKGVARNFTGLEDISESWSYPPLSDNAAAAERVRAALAERGWSLAS
ncbi:mitochondrial fission protein ELM1 [Selaginella moellendorffii]|uniref:mitochondrial fission protein ELM1 n=1 Tax=Selaginella moellendorffii TaxID=88036 RepID=UPI000D1C5B77|nr:mitochondrial fission protein ELM1 [Selaginella moellendorffii]|eukprot:XP_024543424.1 mitochondrial fission protein ELM1 [Selaginella moellendorffii]